VWWAIGILLVLCTLAACVLGLFVVVCAINSTVY